SLVGVLGIRMFENARSPINHFSLCERFFRPCASSWRLERNRHLRSFSNPLWISYPRLNSFYRGCIQTSSRAVNELNSSRMTIWANREPDSCGPLRCWIYFLGRETKSPSVLPSIAFFRCSPQH